MKALFKTTEAYLPQSDEVLIRLSVILFKRISEAKYEPAQEFCMDFRKDHAVEIDDLANKFRTLADYIERFVKENAPQAR